MATYDFTLVLDGDLRDEAVVNALFEAGSDDATLGDLDGIAYADFHREAPSFAAAVDSAIRAVMSVPGLTVTRVEPDDLVTASEIAARLKRTPESVRLLIAGARGPGGFPAPVSHLRMRQRLWRWCEVAAWAGEPAPEAHFIAAVNAALEIARHRTALAQPQRKLVDSLLSNKATDQLMGA